MNRVVVVVISGLLLTACGSLDSLPGLGGSSAPTPVTLNLESEPAGADVTLSTGGTCKTPCALPVATAGEVSATFTLEKYLPRTLTAKVIPAKKNFVGMESSPAEFDPNPLRAELQAEPPKRKRRPARKPARTSAKPPAPAAPAAPAAAASTPEPASAPAAAASAPAATAAPPATAPSAPAAAAAPPAAAPSAPAAPPSTPPTSTLTPWPTQQ